MPVTIEIDPGLLVIFYEERGEEWVEIASNYNLTCPLTPGVQKHIGNVFMPLKAFRKILGNTTIRRQASE